METSAITNSRQNNVKGNIIGFLCGYFKIEDTSRPLEERFADPRWKRERLTQDEYNDWCTLYYESYAESLLDREVPSCQKVRKDGIYDSLSYYVMELQKPCSINDKNFIGNYHLCVNRLHIFNFPYGFVLFAIEVESNGIMLNDSNIALKNLRDLSKYNDYLSTDYAKEYMDAIVPLLYVYKASGGKDGYSGLVKTGGKMKLFQIVRCNERSDDELLFDLGCLNKIGAANDPSDINSPSEKYFNEIISQNSISVFKNWKAIALFDTFTVLGIGETFGVRWWAINYFRIIYIHSLFQKVLLFDLNQQFRSSSKDKDMKSLANVMKERERYYTFPTISYNFLPQMIYEKINYGLDVDKERDQLHKYIEQESRRQEEISERRLSRVLFCLSIFTIVSAIYDLSSLISDFSGLNAATCQYRHMVTGVVSGFLFLFSIIYIYNLKKKK